MLTVEHWQRVRHLQAMGWSVRRIARELRLDRRTVARALAAETPPQYQRAASPSPWEAWAAQLATGVRLGLRGSRVLNDLRAAGYTGSRSAFYTHWEQLQAAHRESPATCRFETAPGEQAQFDWAEYTLRIAGIARKVYVFSTLLGYSRRVHWFPSLAVHQEAVFEGVEAGCQHFGGVCRFLVIDNPKVFILRHAGSDLRWNPNFQRLAGYYRFEPIACTPRHPEGKGKVENPFSHLEELFLRGQDWRDWSQFATELAAFEGRWEQRIHGTTKVTPLSRFATEQSALLPLPPTPYLGWHEEFRKVSSDCLISYRGVQYSVPWPYATKQVVVRQSQGRELVVHAVRGEVLTRHEIRPSGAPPVIVAAHYEGLRRRHLATAATLARVFRAQYGEAETAEAFLQRLLGQHRHHPERPLRQVLDLLSGVPNCVAHAALADALEFNLCTPRFLEERLRRLLRAAGEGEPAGWPGGASAAHPGPPGQLTLPQLEVERALTAYGRALDPAGPEPA